MKKVLTPHGKLMGILLKTSELKIDVEKASKHIYKLFDRKITAPTRFERETAIDKLNNFWMKFLPDDLDSIEGNFHEITIDYFEFSGFISELFEIEKNMMTEFASWLFNSGWYQYDVQEPGCVGVWYNGEEEKVIEEIYELWLNQSAHLINEAIKTNTGNEPTISNSNNCPDY